MKKRPPATTLVQTPQELLQEICAPHILPDENAEIFDALHQALFSDLAPVTPYESLLAEQLVALEWDALRHRRMHDALLRAEFRELAVGAFQEGEVGRIPRMMQRDGAQELAVDLVASAPERRQAALEELAKHGIPVEELMATAYRRLAKALEPHERQIAEIETRRRKLREDYADATALRAARAVDEAVEVEG